jgi:hypothetical protein
MRFNNNSVMKTPTYFPQSPGAFNPQTRKDNYYNFFYYLYFILANNYWSNSSPNHGFNIYMSPGNAYK